MKAFVCNSPDIEAFNRNAKAFWDEKGVFSGLHKLMSVRMAYIKEQLPENLKELEVLDVGCGGGLVAEALARLGARVTGLDQGEAVLEVARAHAREQGLDIAYHQGSAESFSRGKAQFDVIVALEVVEHVPDLKAFFEALGGMLKKDGVLIVATLNRTLKSYLYGIVMAELVLGWAPAGSHAWDQFARPSELAALAAPLGLRARDVCGVVYSPFKGGFVLRKGRTEVNYMMSFQKTG
ncbi:MAG: bifunctional 2-polyprenyl-6-hydroxyphenol methylase/3-demethylubiquinol 3-O-methyltransferase UbiG [Alphaproteobacteria bacterium]|nr:bifunctional 2-polyprenyl-6-hydroxyphenol methylase/3-demethylubiquinol 3-O-methyltransferase UbiG [Alphaproteobacteria bacterium]